MSQSSFFSRLESCQGYDEPVEQFMKRLRVARTEFYRWKAGRIPRPKRINELAQILDIRSGWLAWGELPKERGPNDSGEFHTLVEFKHKKKKDE